MSKQFNVPGANQLRTSGVAVVESADFGVDQKLEIYANGFVWYRHDRHQTVFRLHKVENLYYATPEEEKTPLPWHFHLMMIGEDHILKNMQRADEKKSLTKDEMEEDNAAFADKQCVDPLELVIQEERQLFLYKYLTKQQSEVVFLYYGEKMTQEEIAECLQKSRSAVKKTLALARKKLMSNKEEILRFF